MTQNEQNENLLIYWECFFLKFADLTMNACPAHDTTDDLYLIKVK